MTIYLAAGASFGVSRYLCATGRSKGLRRSFIEGFAAALLWPTVAAAILFKRLRQGYADGAAEESDAGVEARIEEARRAFVVSVNRMLEEVRSSRTLNVDGMERTLYALREGAEQYVGLARVEAVVDEDAAPAAHEIELARISGRRGRDLLLAGRCAHRRNVRRIKIGYERARSRLLRKLSELRAEEGNSLPPKHDNGGRGERRKMSEARLEIYLRATDLFSLIEDKRAAGIAAQLLDAECSYLGQLQEESVEEGDESRAPLEERCTEHRPQLIYTDRQRATTFTQG